MKILGLTWRERRLLDRICYERPSPIRIIGVISDTQVYDHFSFPDDRGFSRDPVPLESLIKKKLVYEHPILARIHPGHKKKIGTMGGMAIYAATGDGHRLIHRINENWRKLCRSKS